MKAIDADADTHTANGVTAADNGASPMQHALPDWSPLAAMLREQHRQATRPITQLALGEGEAAIQILDTHIGPATRDVARGLFSALRDLDKRDVEVILVEGIEQDCNEEDDIAAAVMNRLRKAAEEQITA